MRPRISFLDRRLARALFGAGVGCTFVALGAAGCAGKPEAGARVKKPAGDFHQIPIISAAGESAPFSAVLAMRPALVSFWAPWCEPCVRELPDLERLSRSTAQCGGAVLGVAVGETPIAITAFMRGRHLSYPQFTDQQFQLADALGQTRIPTTVVFDGAGRVVFVGERLDRRAVAALAGTFGNVPSPAGCTLSEAFERKVAEASAGDATKNDAEKRAEGQPP